MGLPTDTVYGVGCDAFDADAVAAVLAAKGRGRDMPPPVLIPTARTAHGLAAQVADYASTLMDRFWPGPLTVILRAQTSLHWDLGETNGTVALRDPPALGRPRAGERRAPALDALCVGRDDRHAIAEAGEPRRHVDARHLARVRCGRGADDERHGATAPGR